MKGRVLLLVTLLVVALFTIAACGGEENGDGAEPPPATTEPGATSPAGDAADGEEVFASECASCHGEDGSGGIGPDLRGEDDVAGIEQQVRNGASGMPAFEGVLSDAQIQAVSQYVTEL
jgi:cytochrome c551